MWVDKNGTLSHSETRLLYKDVDIQSAFLSFLVTTGRLMNFLETFETYNV